MHRLRLVHRDASGPEELLVELEGHRFALRRGDAIERGEAVRLPDGRISLILESGRQLSGRVLPGKPGEVQLAVAGRVQRISLAEPIQDHLAHASDAGGAAGSDEEVRALMPGRVVEVSVAPGDTVPRGGLLLVLEAMKMQNEIRAERGGVVGRLAVSAGAAVDRGALLLVLQPGPSVIQ